MSRARKLNNPKHYSLVIEEETLFTFKRMVNRGSLTTSDVIRVMIDNYIDENTSDDKSTRTDSDIMRGIKDQIDILINSHSFKLNDLVSVDSRKAVKELRSFQVAYIHGDAPRKYHIPIGYGEYLHVKYSSDSVAVITSTVHDIVIRQKGFFLYIDMPNIYTDTTDELFKFCMVNDLMQTLRQIANCYKDNMLISLGRHELTIESRI